MKPVFMVSWCSGITKDFDIFDIGYPSTRVRIPVRPFIFFKLLCFLSSVVELFAVMFYSYFKAPLRKGPRFDPWRERLFYNIKNKILFILYYQPYLFNYKTINEYENKARLLKLFNFS